MRNPIYFAQIFRSCRRSQVSILLLAFISFIHVAFADDYTWGSDVSGNWSDSSGGTGWDAGGAVPDTAGDTATLTLDISSDRIITVDVANAIVGTLNIGDGSGTSGWTAGTTDVVNNQLTFEVGSGNAVLNASGGTNIFDVGVVLNSTLEVSNSSLLQMNGAVSGSGGIIKSGGSTLDFGTAVNSFTGPLTILEGTVQMTNGAPLAGVTAIQLGDASGSADATLYIDNTGTSGPNLDGAKTITVQSGNTGTAMIQTRRKVVSSAIVLGSGTEGHDILLDILQDGGGFTGVISDPAGLSGTAGVVTIDGHGKLTSFGNKSSTYTGGTVIENGNINLSSGTGSYFGTGPLTVNGGAWQFGGQAATVTDISSLILNASLVTKGSNTEVSFASAAVNLGATGTDTTRIFDINSNSSDDYVTINGVISNGTNGFTTGITKTGARTLNLGGSNTFTGATVIDEGTLNLSGTLSASSAVEINDGGTLSGGGNAAGTVTVNSGGTISPGNSPGTLSTGAQIWEGGGTYIWEINDFAGTEGSDPGWDLLSMSGGLTLNATNGDPFTIAVTSLTSGNSPGAADNFVDGDSYQFLIADATGSITGFDATAFTVDTSAFNNAFTGDWGVYLGSDSGITGGDDTELYLGYNIVIPEPGSILLLVTGFTVLVLFRRKS